MCQSWFFRKAELFPSCLSFCLLWIHQANTLVYNRPSDLDTLTQWPLSAARISPPVGLISWCFDKFSESCGCKTTSSLDVQPCCLFTDWRLGLEIIPYTIYLTLNTEMLHYSLQYYIVTHSNLLIILYSGICVVLIIIISRLLISFLFHTFSSKFFKYI